MKLLFCFLVLIVFSCLSIGCVYNNFDFKKRDKSLLEVSKKKSYVLPSFNFKSKEYKRFVYAK